jgi:hypothetical protein
VEVRQNTFNREDIMTATRNLKLTLIAAAIAAFAGTSLAQQTTPAPTAPQTQVVRPADLLTQQERDAFRKQMEQATTVEERQKVRDAHRAALEQRAQERGVQLGQPGRGPGYGPGAGFGPRDGYGPRDGRGPGYGPRADGRGPGYGPRADGVYNQVFTQAERDRFAERMREAQSVEQRQAIRDEVRTLADARAKELGIAPQQRRGPGAGEHRHGDGPRAGGPGRHGYGPMAQLFTDAERDQFRDRMHGAQTVEERQQIRDEMRNAAETRAKEKGITLPQGPRGPGYGPRGPAAPQT